MTTIRNQGIFGGRVARAASLGLLAAAALLLPGEARAQWTTSGTTTTTTNNVGVGTTTPATSLHVSTPSTAISRGVTSEQTSADGNGAMFVLKKNRAGAAALNGDSIGNLYPEAFDGTSFVSGARLRFAIDGPVSAGSVPTSLQFYTGTGANGGVERARISSAGNFGVGTATPQSLLDVSGSTGMTLRNGGASSGFSFFDRASVPGDQVVIQGNAGNYSMVNVATRGANVGTEKGAGLSFWTVDIANTTNATMFQMHYTPNYGPVFFTYKFGTGAQGDKKISFQSAWQNPASAPTQLVLDTNGSVGIGTNTPVSKLHVVGDITVTGNINAKYQDVAEWVPSTQKLAVGTVVIIDADGVNHVSASTAAYATSVAGVITGQPGLLLGEEGEGKVKVATTGRVKVKVDATRAPIKAGDLLVTSETPGVAMRSEPVSVGGVAMHRPGTLIGKALEPLAKGTGEILVLLSLQ
jgi:hypothetical protein